MPMNTANKYYTSQWRRDFANGQMIDSGVHFIAGLRMVAGAAGLGEAVRPPRQGPHCTSRILSAAAANVAACLPCCGSQTGTAKTCLYPQQAVLHCGQVLPSLPPQVSVTAATRQAKPDLSAPDTCVGLVRWSSSHAASSVSISLAAAQVRRPILHVMVGGSE
jgi:hypothetical protein